jgi:hypothetical protein
MFNTVISKALGDGCEATRYCASIDGVADAGWRCADRAIADTGNGNGWDRGGRGACRWWVQGGGKFGIIRLWMRFLCNFGVEGFGRKCLVDLLHSSFDTIRGGKSGHLHRRGKTATGTVATTATTWAWKGLRLKNLDLPSCRMVWYGEASTWSLGGRRYTYVHRRGSGRNRKFSVDVILYVGYSD